MLCPVGPAVVRCVSVGRRVGCSRVNLVRPGREQPKPGRWALAGSGAEGGLAVLPLGQPVGPWGAAAAPIMVAA